MKIKLFLMLVALSCINPIYGKREQTKKVAILETVDKENVVSYGVKLMVRSKLAFAITNMPGYEGYDRVDIASIMSEQEFQRTGMVSDAQIKRLGEMTGADYILVAEVAKLDDKRIIIVSKIIDVETARLEKTSNIQTATDVEEMEESCRKLAARLFGIQRERTTVLSGDKSKKIPVGHDFIEMAAGLNMKMIYVEGGKFLMGATSEQGGDDNEYHVKLDSYYIGECEVTQAQWEKLMGTSIQLQVSKEELAFNKNIGPNHPMCYVSWEEARAFCKELSRITGKTYCLPTEAQWEYAARGGKKNEDTKYSGSWSIDAVAWYANNSGYCAHPVKTKHPNGLGIYDMSGNVWEWCSDWYSSSYNKEDTNNPVGPSSGSTRVLRGGTWGSQEHSCCVSYRNHGGTNMRYNDIGFRVVVIL